MFSTAWNFILLKCPNKHQKFTIYFKLYSQKTDRATHYLITGRACFLGVHSYLLDYKANQQV